MKTIKDIAIKCLRHFLAFLVTNNETAHLQFLCSYLGIDEKTLMSWIREESKPKGLRLIKIAYYLHLVGYDVEDLYKDKITITSARILSSGWTTPKEMAGSIGYSEEFDLYRVIFGKRGMSPRVLKKFEKFNNQFKEQLKEPSKIFEGRVEKLTPQNLSKGPATISMDYTNDKKTDIQLLANLIIAYGNMSQALEPLLKQFMENSTSEERQILRDNISSQGVLSLFTFSNSIFRSSKDLNALCTEKSFELNQKNL